MLSGHSDADGGLHSRAGRAAQAQLGRFAGAIARRVHDHGMPISQGELVRDMMECSRAARTSRHPTSE